MTKDELRRRQAGFVPVLPTYCQHYFNKRDGDGVYECRRDGVYWCEGCYQPENDDRPLCARHRVCDVCGRKATKKITSPT
jgi:ribosomal protein L37AE/L43A